MYKRYQSYTKGGKILLLFHYSLFFNSSLCEIWSDLSIRGEMGVKALLVHLSSFECMFAGEEHSLEIHYLAPTVFLLHLYPRTLDYRWCLILHRWTVFLMIL